jgi:hypothetical protein
MLATECSKPAAMKANRRHQIRLHLAASPVARALVHNARQTSQLHRAPRAISASGAALILAAEAVDEVCSVFQDLPAAAEPKNRGQHNGPREVAEPAEDPSARERREIGRASGDADRHKHRMAGEKIRACEGHERERNAEARAHRETEQGRLDLLA